MDRWAFLSTGGVGAGGQRVAERKGGGSGGEVGFWLTCPSRILAGGRQGVRHHLGQRPVRTCSDIRGWGF